MTIGLSKVTWLADRWVVSSSTKAPGSALLVENGHVETLACQAGAAALGAAVRRAWQASEALPQLSEGVLDRSAASDALGFRDVDALLAAGARLVVVNLVAGTVKVTATRNEGPGGSFAGLPDPVRADPEQLTDEALGQLVIDGLQRSQ